jgi:hypothetical protein
MHNTSNRKSNTTTARIIYGRVLPYNRSPTSNKNLHVVHNTSHAIKVKQDTLLRLLVIYIPRLALLQQRVKFLKT